MQRHHWFLAVLTLFWLAFIVTVGTKPEVQGRVIFPAPKTEFPPGFTVTYIVSRATDHAELVRALADSTGDSLLVARLLNHPWCTVDSAALIGGDAPYDSLVAWLVTDTAVADGRRYLERNHAFLDSLADRTGVPAELYVGVYRFETNFGRHTGMFKMLPAVYTWYAVARSERTKAFWRGELAATIRLARDGVIDPFRTPCSRKGAFGLTQFMPSQFYLARDGDGDGRVNLFSPRDALESTGSHFLANGNGDSRRALLRMLRQYNKGAYGRALLKYAEMLQISRT